MSHYFHIGLASLLCFMGFMGMCFGILRTPKTRPHDERGCFDESDAFAGMAFLAIGVVMLVLNWNR